MLTSYHNHTTWSDGKASLAEMVAAGRNAGLDELGISDHYVLAPHELDVEWSMPLARVGEYVAELREAAGTAGVTLRTGIEADFFPETVEDLRDQLAAFPFDYVIGSVHYLDGFPIDESAGQWEALGELERNAMWRGYWERIGQLAASGVYDFAAHLDLPKKFGFRPTIDLTDNALAALDAIAAADMAIEINTAGWSLPAREAYPAFDLLRAARDRGIPLLINADAHRPEHLTHDFDRARDLARRAGYTELVRYERRRRFPVTLSGGQGT